MHQPAASPEQLHDRLRDDVLDLVFSPGASVTEAAVSVRYGVARPTAKLAIERLVADGLLTRTANRAARVPVITPDDVRDLYDARAIVEVAAVQRLAVEGSIPADALRAHRALLAVDQEAGVFARLDADFHRALVAGQPSPRLRRLHEQLMGEVELCIAQVQARRLLTAAEIAGQHQRILDAVVAGDADAAAAETRAHIDGARDRLLTTESVAPESVTTEPVTTEERP